MDKPIFYTYMLTNFEMTVVYTGFTNNLASRVVEHWLGVKQDAFSHRYNVHYLVWFEETRYVLNAIAKENELKSMSRNQKDALITEFNPGWQFLNEHILGNWPPNEAQIELAKERILSDKFSCARFHSGMEKSLK